MASYTHILTKEKKITPPTLHLHLKPRPCEGSCKVAHRQFSKAGFCNMFYSQTSTGLQRCLKCCQIYFLETVQIEQPLWEPPPPPWVWATWKLRCVFTNFNNIVVSLYYFLYTYQCFYLFVGRERYKVVVTASSHWKSPEKPSNRPVCPCRGSEHKEVPSGKRPIHLLCHIPLCGCPLPPSRFVAPHIDAVKGVSESRCELFSHKGAGRLHDAHWSIVIYNIAVFFHI